MVILSCYWWLSDALVSVVYELLYGGLELLIRDHAIVVLVDERNQVPPLLLVFFELVLESALLTLNLVHGLGRQGARIKTRL